MYCCCYANVGIHMQLFWRLFVCSSSAVRLLQCFILYKLANAVRPTTAACQINSPVVSAIIDIGQGNTCGEQMGHKVHQYQVHGNDVTEQISLATNETQNSPAPGSRNHCNYINISDEKWDTQITSNIHGTDVTKEIPLVKNRAPAVLSRFLASSAQRNIATSPLMGTRLL